MSKAKRNQKTFYAYLNSPDNSLTRFVIKANTERGAVGKVSKETGQRFRNYSDSQYIAKGMTLTVEADSHDGHALYRDSIKANYVNAFLL